METSDIILIVLLSVVGIYLLMQHEGLCGGKKLLMCNTVIADGQAPPPLALNALPAQQGESMQPKSSHAWLSRYDEMQKEAQRDGIDYKKQDYNQLYAEQNRALEGFDWEERPRSEERRV